jgi:hypothetical protein
MYSLKTDRREPQGVTNPKCGISDERSGELREAGKDVSTHASQVSTVEM